MEFYQNGENTIYKWSSLAPSLAPSPIANLEETP